MKTCSYCGKMNEDSLTWCHECGLELSLPDAPAQQPSGDPRPLAIVATFGDSVEASILRARLEQAGIEACIPEELEPSPFGNFVPLAHVTVRVAERDLAAAKEILGTAV